MADTRQTLHDTPMSNASTPSSPRSFLLVDDHAGFRRTVRDFLPDDAGEVIECANGEEALEAYATHHPDWTLMDIEMPGMDGLSATRAIRAEHPEARIIIVTSYDSPDVRTDGTGLTNLFKYTAGLIPYDSTSDFLLELHPVSGEPDHKEISYGPSFADRNYTILFSTDLNEWFPLADTTAGVGGTATFLDTAAGIPRKFYRIQIIKP